MTSSKGRLLVSGMVLAAILGRPLPGTAQATGAQDAGWPSTDYASMDGQALYRAACAGCHGPDSMAAGSSTMPATVRTSVTSP